MPDLTNIHDVSTLGQTRTVDFTGVAASQTLVADATGRTPVSFLLLATEDCFIRQGPSASAPTADDEDFLLKADTYVRITVRDSESNAISVIQSSASGTLYITENNSDTPATDSE